MCIWQYSEGWNPSPMPAPIFVTRPFILTQLPQHLAEEFGSTQDYFHWLNNPPNKTLTVKVGIHPGTKLAKESFHCFLLSFKMKIMLSQFFSCTSECSSSIFSQTIASDFKRNTLLLPPCFYSATETRAICKEY